MGIFDDKDDKTEEATPKRRTDAAKKGQVAMSQELSMAALLIAAVIALEFVGSSILAAMRTGLAHGLTVKRYEHADIEWFTATILDSMWRILPSLLPLMAMLVVVALIAGVGQIGFKPSWEKLSPKFEKLNPINGLKRLFSPRGLVKAGLSVFKLVALTTVLWLALSAELTDILLLPELPFEDAAPRIGRLAIGILWWIAVPLAVIAFLDLLYQRWQHSKDLRMSKTEVKDEGKQAEGDPEVKARIRRAQRDLARRRMMDEVPKAEVILTNPTHYAVALKYERANMGAPRVVAKGTELVALRIREIAKEHGVPIVEDPPLTRALYRNVRLGDEIPATFYRAVAAILSQVMRLEKEAI